MFSRKATPAEQQATKVITQALRQQGQKYLAQCMTTGSEANNSTAQLLKQSLPVLELIQDKLGVMFLK